MFCSNCGKEIPDDSKYCPFCGTNVSNLPYSDTPARDDTELHVEYLRMTPTKPKVIDEKVPNDIKRLKILAKISSIIVFFLFLMLMATCPIANFVADSGASRKFQIFGAAWFISVSVILIAITALHLTINILDKNAVRALGGSRARKNRTINIVAAVFAVISAGFFCTYAYFLLANPAFCINTKNIWLRIVATILAFIDIIVLALAFKTYSHLATTPKRQSITK